MRLGPAMPGGRSFQSGKNGMGYLLTPSLGGIGGEAFKGRICDGAYGAPAAALPESSPDLHALGLADSVAVDPHTGDRRTYDARNRVRVVHDRESQLREVTTRSRDGLTIRLNFPERVAS